MLALKSITAQRFDRSLRSESVRNKIKIFETEINVGILNAPIVPNFTVFLLAFELFEKTKDVLSRDLTLYGPISARQNRVCPCQSMVV